jgi:hypothetical protein
MSVIPSSANTLKEWAAICHALLEGEQVIDLRKGGLREQSRHFEVQAERAWLYPTVEHQKPELLKPAYRHWIELAAGAPVGGPITISGWVEITDTITIDTAEALDALAGRVVWTPEYAQSRLNWKSRDPLWVLVVRAHRLLEPITIPWNEAYGGCTSWVDLGGLPTDPADSASEPALSDVAFAARRAGVLEALSQPA